MPNACPRFKVFIVDDSALMRERLAELLETIPQLEVAGTASTVPAAIAGINAGGVHAVILDLDLNGGSGLDVLRAVKQGPSAPIVIVLSIHGYAELGAHCRAAGADHYFEKGTSFDAVLKLLEDLAARHAQKVS